MDSLICAWNISLLSSPSLTWSNMQVNFLGGDNISEIVLRHYLKGGGVTPEEVACVVTNF